MTTHRVPRHLRPVAVAIACMALLSACDRAPEGRATAPPVDAAIPAAVPVVSDWTLPSPDGAAQPDLVAAPDGSVLLSWIEPDAGDHVLRLSRFRDGAWSPPATVARGDDWFVNWADTPHVAQTPDGALWAHWLRKSAAATYAYDVVLARSGDDGATWSAPVTVNDDGTPTEHGFASLWPADDSRIGVAWLDGRATAGGHGGHDAHGGGMMTLRTAMFDAALARSGETRVDASTCDCCQTDVALAGGTPVLAYRDRTAEEIRDIAVVRLEGAHWTAPQPVRADDWTMPACPVNGPSVAADDADVVVAWYTAAGAEPSLRMAHSADGGRTFAPMDDLDQGPALLGRVDLALGDGRAWAAWMREDPDGQQHLQLATGQPGDAPWTALEVAPVAGRGRGTGFPQLALAGGRAHLVWTDVVDGRPRLRGATVGAGP